MSYRVTETRQFKAEFRDAISYIWYSLCNPIAAEALLDEYDHVRKLVAEFPESAMPYPDGIEGEVYRAVGVKNYLAFYVILGDTVEFRRFLYARSEFYRRLSR